MPLVASMRQLQIMLLWFRKITSKLVIQSFVAVAVIVGIFGLCVLFKAAAGELNVSLTVTLTTLQCLFCSFFLVFVAFKYLGKVYHTSVTEQPQGQHARNNKYLRKFLGSCSVQKIYIGDINFFENGTCLVISNYIIDQAVGLLLLNG